jgi:inositol 1,4,5-triphosphate receptor type 1/inositol 1,4,5-triphosphate receptor type 3
MKDEFHSKIDRSSAKTKTEYLLNNVEFFRFQLIINKKILDAFSNAPILDLFFNHYKFYRDVFFILAIAINFLIFISYFRTNDDKIEVTLKTRDLLFDYGFLYMKDYIRVTRILFFILTIIELVFSVLILVNYLIFRVSYLIYYKEEKEEPDENDDIEEEEYKKKTMLYFARNGDIFKYLFERLGNFLINLIKDVKLIYHLILLAVIISTLITKNYKILSILLFDVIERSSTLMCIVKSFLIPIKKIMISLVLFYLIAYFFIIFVYLYIPDQLPYQDCLRFSNCYFILCDQTIKNSNGIINYLTEAGLYTCPTMWSNPRFWIDNWFAIIDLILVLQMICGIIVDTFLSQREKIKEMEEDKNNVCFICGLNKNDINKYYTQSEYRFNEHIKLDHYLWNYMFAIFNVTLMEKPTFFLDKVIKEEYESNQYSKFIPYKKCLKQLEIELDNKENVENKNEEEFGED